ncbi:helix-turn-helix domain-containing protein [Streptomyces sp. NBC_00285]|uniref:helix-turn-helix domain-containing protein n=1 Tax=Streptomyces sp. NBC_00285 TaxID=2975700 RepID=UPI002E2E6151|nr:helix-turn-helix domain-containing protein [Streptomyces sp. NBC_00285]
MAEFVNGPVVVLDGADCLHLAPLLARGLKEQGRRDGGVPPRLQAIAEMVLAGARTYRAAALAGSDAGTDQFRDGVPDAPCVSSALRLTAEEAAGLLRCSPGYVRRLCRQGTLAGVRTAGKGAWLVDEAAVLERVGERRTEAA